MSAQPELNTAPATNVASPRSMARPRLGLTQAGRSPHPNGSWRVAGSRHGESGWMPPTGLRCPMRGDYEGIKMASGPQVAESATCAGDWECERAPTPVRSSSCLAQQLGDGRSVGGRKTPRHRQVTSCAEATLTAADATASGMKSSVVAVRCRRPKSKSSNTVLSCCVAVADDLTS